MTNETHLPFGRSSLVVRRQLPPGVPEAIGVALCFGISFWALDFVTPALGILWPVLVLRIVEAVAVVLFLLRRRTPPARLTRGMAALVLAAARWIRWRLWRSTLGSAAPTRRSLRRWPRCSAL